MIKVLTNDLGLYTLERNGRSRIRPAYGRILKISLASKIFYSLELRVLKPLNLDDLRTISDRTIRVIQNMFYS